ncbi:MAG: hypothetical protein IJ167_02770 [Lachnospiraceae bacterium]|nr:hypothetical protein [Lachnospiraceae bacterium]
MFKFRKKILVLIMSVLILCLACACGKKKENYIGDINENTITINEDGSIREIACENFSDTSYDISGLKDDIKSDIEKYCGSDKKDAVKLLEYKEDSKIVKVAIDYKSLDDYNAFNGTSYMNSQDLLAFGDVALKDMAGNDIYVSGIDTSVAAYKIFSADSAFTLNISGEIVYYNGHVSINGSNSAKFDGLGNAIIIYK